jgi:SAM-dependent methyltransferase
VADSWPLVETTGYTLRCELNPEEYAIMYRIEDSFWWYKGMERITRAVIEQWYAPGSGLRILDAGCGTGGAMSSYLADYGPVTGFDFSTEALRFVHLRGIRRVIRASVMQVPFADRCFDLVVSADVLCERAVPDDLAALLEMNRVLVPGGRVLLRLPAYNWLRGQHDEAVHIRHRYTRGEVASRLRQSGFEVEFLSYANTLLFPVALAKRMAERVWPVRSGRSDLTIPTGPFNGLLRAILSAEASLVANPGLPFGLTVIGVGRKQQHGA